MIAQQDWKRVAETLSYLAAVFLVTLTGLSVFVSLAIFQVYVSEIKQYWLLPYLVDASYKLTFFVFFEYLFIIALPLLSGAYIYRIKNLTSLPEKPNREPKFVIKNPYFLLLLVILIVVNAIFLLRNKQILFDIIFLLTIVLYSFYPFLKSFKPLVIQRSLKNTSRIDKFEKFGKFYFVFFFNFVSFTSYMLFLLQGVTISYYSTYKLNVIESFFLLSFMFGTIMVLNYLGFSIIKVSSENNKPVQAYLYSSFALAMAAFVLWAISSFWLPTTNIILKTSGIGAFYAKISYKGHTTSNFAVVADVDKMLFVEKIGGRMSSKNEINKSAKSTSCEKILLIPISDVKSIDEVPGPPVKFCNKTDAMKP